MGSGEVNWRLVGPGPREIVGFWDSQDEQQGDGHDGEPLAHLVDHLTQDMGDEATTNQGN